MQRCLALAAVCALATTSCRESEGPPEAVAANLLLLPETSRAIVDRDFRLMFYDGLGADGAPLERLVDSFDPFMARVGGYQVNLLEPRIDGGAVCVDVRLPETGGSMVGFSTKPRRVRWEDGETVLLSQHVKSLFPVTDSELHAPVPSAAVAYRLGLRLEIVSMLDPLPLLPRDQLPLQVRFDGPELAGAEVEVRLSPRGGGDTEIVLRERTDDAGTVVLPIDRPGRYTARVTHDPVGSGMGREVHRAALTFNSGGIR